MTPEERRLKLADFLEHTVKPALDGAKFDMRNWGTANADKLGLAAKDKHKIPSRQLVETSGLSKLSECGFAGCAVGWGYYCVELFKEGIPVSTTLCGLVSGYEELAIFFFGSSSDEDFNKSEYVFSPDSYYDPKNIDAVISRLREGYTNA